MTPWIIVLLHYISNKVHLSQYYFTFIITAQGPLLPSGLSKHIGV